MGFGSILESLKEADPFEKEANIFGDDAQGLLNPGFLAGRKLREDVARHFKGDPNTPPPPPDSGTLLTMPSLTDSDRRNAARKAAADMRRRGGRSSTILTGDYLGGGL